MRILEPPPIPSQVRRPERIALDFRHLRPHEQDEAVQAEQLKQTTETLAEDVYQMSVRDECLRLAGWIIRNRRVLDLDSVREFIAILDGESKEK